MESRQLRRAAERQHIKELRKAYRENPAEPSPALYRAETNRANSQHSTGPKSPEGKAVSSGNSFKHGLYSKQLVIPGEDPAALDALKSDLRAEHQPVNTTEEILVNEIAEHYWRIRRYRAIEPRLLTSDDAEQILLVISKLLPVVQRVLTAAERGLHKSLTALRQLQKDRGFVPQSAAAVADTRHAEPPSAPSESSAADSAAVGFVPRNSENTQSPPSVQAAANCAHNTAFADPIAGESHFLETLKAQR